jgi:hypothetical protein
MPRAIELPANRSTDAPECLNGFSKGAPRGESA